MIFSLESIKIISIKGFYHPCWASSLTKHCIRFDDSEDAVSEKQKGNERRKVDSWIKYTRETLSYSTNIHTQKTFRDTYASERNSHLCMKVGICVFFVRCRIIY